MKSLEMAPSTPDGDGRNGASSGFQLFRSKTKNYTHHTPLSMMCVSFGDTSYSIKKIKENFSILFAILLLIICLNIINYV